MTTLTGSKPGNSYKQLLQLPTLNSGITSSYQAIQDGEGTATGCEISTTGLRIASNLAITATSIASANNTLTVNGLTVTASTGTFTLTSGKTLSVSNTLTFTGTDGSSVAFGTGGTVAYTANTLAVFASTTSAQLAGVISDETGSGSLVFNTSPTFVTPILGTPTSGNLSNCTALPLGSITGLGTGVSTWLATPSSANLRGAITDETGTGVAVFNDTPTLIAPLLGTPTSGNLSNCTSLPVSTGISGLGTGVATFLATPSSVNLASAVTDETGSGALVFGTSPTLTDTVTIAGTASNASRLRMAEDTDNGSNYIEHQAPASIASNRTVTWPDTDISQHLVQRVSTLTGAVATGTTTIPQDDTIPQNSEGTGFMDVTITPKHTSNILVLDVIANLSSSATNAQITGAIFQTAGIADAIAAGMIRCTYANNAGAQLVIRHIMTAGTTSATTFYFRAGGSAASTITFNGHTSGRIFGGVMSSSFTISEYSP